MCLDFTAFFSLRLCFYVTINSKLKLITCFILFSQKHSRWQRPNRICQPSSWFSSETAEPAKRRSSNVTWRASSRRSTSPRSESRSIPSFSTPTEGPSGNSCSTLFQLCYSYTFQLIKISRKQMFFAPLRITNLNHT